MACRSLAAPAPTAVVHAEGRQVVRGWGVALAWDANVVFGSAEDAPHLTSRAEQGRFMDLLFGDPAHGLGLNVARYNIGGGDNPDRERCRDPARHDVQPGARMEGFLDGPERPYVWNRDASQRWMLHEAAARGATIFEAFSNSAPWWMTRSGCASGADRAGEDNLRADMVPAFAAYLAEVAGHFCRADGVCFEDVSPVNEPDGAWWVRGERQEGSFASLPMQDAVVEATAQALQGTGVIVAGTDVNDFDHMTAALDQLGPGAVAALGRVNVHLYDGRDEGALRRRIEGLGKRLWMSEVGCCLAAHRGDPTGALTMALSIERSLNGLGAEVWCFWQAGWGVIDVRRGRARPLAQYWAIGQYTRFIRPGDTVLAVEGPVVAVRSPKGRVSVVAVNAGGAARRVVVDLGAVVVGGQAVRVQRTVPGRGLAVIRRRMRLDERGRLVDWQPGGSVTTYVVGIK